jgi:hypothetical protein
MVNEGLVAKWLCTGFLNRETWVRSPPDPRRISGRAIGRPHGSTTRFRSTPLVETAKQVKCCGDTPVRHTGIRGFDSPHLLRCAARARSPARSLRSLLRSLAALRSAPRGATPRRRGARRSAPSLSFISLRVDFTLCPHPTGSGPGCSSQVPWGHDESDASFSAGLADRLGDGLPPRPDGFDSRGPHAFGFSRSLSPL